jgi:putative peptidoglycan lipid II flippase
LLANETKRAARAEPGLLPELGAGIARGAAIVAGLTLLSRLLGLLRTLVFSQAVGATCLGGAYVTTGQVPISSTSWSLAVR